MERADYAATLCPPAIVRSSCTRNSLAKTRLRINSGAMATFRYYVSREPSAPSPPTDQLSSIEAPSHRQAAIKLAQQRRLHGDDELVWAHFLTWVSASGQQRGFESIWLGDVLKSPGSPHSG
jgi:hypothetical protein